MFLHYILLENNIVEGGVRGATFELITHQLKTLFSPTMFVEYSEAILRAYTSFFGFTVK